MSNSFIFPADLVQKIVNILQELPYRSSGDTINAIRAIVEKAIKEKPVSRDTGSASGPSET